MSMCNPEKMKLYPISNVYRSSIVCNIVCKRSFTHCSNTLFNEEMRNDGGNFHCETFIEYVHILIQAQEIGEI